MSHSVIAEKVQSDRREKQGTYNVTPPVDQEMDLELIRWFRSLLFHRGHRNPIGVV